MDFDCKSHYNNLRMRWLEDSSLEVEPWQVTDYRVLTLEEIFGQLHYLNIHLDRQSFVAYAKSAETPEDLVDLILEEDHYQEDRIYLLLFELWRRFIPENPSLSIFCDELDFLISSYESKDKSIASFEALQDILANLKEILDENTDVGANPQESFAVICDICAHDVEGFFYNFISDQIDAKNLAYASDLLEEFSPYFQDKKWFDFLGARLISFQDMLEANRIVFRILKDNAKTSDLDFYFELLDFMVLVGDWDLFVYLIEQMIPLLKTEEDFKDLLLSSSDYFSCIDRDIEDAKISAILEKRQGISSQQHLEKEDEDLCDFLKILRT